MGAIRTRFPSLSFVQLGELVQIVVRERNAVMALTKVYERARWGKACLACNVVRDRIRELATLGTCPWLRYVAETGMAYTVLVGNIPLRIQPDIEEIRGMMPGERLAHNQLALFPKSPDADNLVLRLEVTQPAGDDVKAITLFLFDEKSGDTLDAELLYSSSATTTTTNANVVTPLMRPADSPDISGFFEFETDDRDVTADGED